MKEQVHVQQKNLVSPIFQMMLIIISTAILSLALYYRLGLFRTTDPQEPLGTITPKKLSEFGGFPSDIDVGLSIDKFQTFDIVNNNFTFSGYVWFSFEPGAISLATLENFEFKRGEFLSKPRVDLQILKDKILANYSMRLHFTSDLDYTYFPFDNHRIFIVLTHPLITPQEFIFTSLDQQFVINQPNQSGWTLLNKDVQFGYTEVKLDENDVSKNRLQPTVIFALDFIRSSIRYVLLILLPLVLILYLTLFSFSMAENTVTLASLGITALVSYRFVIENLSPRVGYFMISDYIFFIFLLSAFMIFFIHVADMFLHRFSINQKKLMIIFIHFFSIGSSIYFFLLWR